VGRWRFDWTWDWVLGDGDCLVLGTEVMDLKEVMLREQKGDGVLMIVFLVIALGLAVVGYVRGEGVWYIRTGIFCVAVLFLWWRRKR
jgi:hypothetical protein